MSAAGTTDAAKVTFVLVPGAGFGAWVWSPVAAALQQGGHDVVALTLPGQSYGGAPATQVGLEDAVAHVVAEVERRDLHEVVLVGHSWGGYPITGAAHRIADRLARVVYLSAVVPQRGVAMADEDEQVGAFMRAAIEASGAVPTPPEAVRGLYMSDAPAPVADLVAALLLPQPGGYVLDALDVPPVTEAGIAASYVLFADDAALVRPGAQMAARIGAEPVVVPGSHLGLLTHPRQTAAALLALA